MPLASNPKTQIATVLPMMLPLEAIGRQSPLRFSSAGSFAILLATRRASSIVSNLGGVSIGPRLARIDIRERLAVGILHHMVTWDALQRSKALKRRAIRRHSN
jgi:hypothetical protein